MREINIKVKKYILPDLNNPKKSKFWKKLPEYDSSAAQRILVRSATDSGKTETMKVLAQAFIDSGAKYVILMFPKVSIGKAKEGGDWKLLYDGEKRKDYPEVFMATYDNLGHIPNEVLKEAVIIVDELHELATSGFRPVLKPLFNKLFKYSPYIVGMSGTLNHQIFEEEFETLINVKQRSKPTRILHDVICHKKVIGYNGEANETTYSPQDFIEYRMSVSKATHFLIFVESKKECHRIAKSLGGKAIVHHSGESHKTILPDVKAKQMVEDGIFPEGVNILISTSGLLAGWDLKVGAHQVVEVIIADLHLNVSRLEAMLQADSRKRASDESHIYKMQALPTKKADSRRYNHSMSVQKLKLRLDELRSMSPSERSHTREANTLVIGDNLDELSIVGKWEFYQGEMDRAYNSFSGTTTASRRAYAQFLGFSDVIRETAPTLIEKVMKEDVDDETRDMKAAMIKVIEEMPLNFKEEWLKEYLSEASLGDGVTLGGVSLGDAGDAGGRMGGCEAMLNAYALACKWYERPMVAMITDVMKLLQIYRRSDLLNYYKYPNAVLPGTLLEQWRDFKSVSLTNIKMRVALLKWLKEVEVFTSAELSEWIEMHEDLFSDKKVYREKMTGGKKRSAGRLAKGLVLLQQYDSGVTTHKQIYEVRSRVPFYVKPMRSAVRKILEPMGYPERKANRLLYDWGL